MSEFQGRLELTWTNKHLRLLAHEDGRYEWVSPSDYRVAEVRLLDDVTSVGEVSSDRARDNLLIRGDALNALRSLARLPEFASEYLGKVKLAYLDPPFNTQQSFLQYDDALEHSVWLTMMRDRLAQIRELLAPDGSVWVHLDDSEVAYCRVMMDELFGRDNFVATVVWQKSYTRENRTDISTVHDYMLLYARDRAAWASARNLLPPTAEQIGRYRNPDNDPRGPWKALPPHAKAGVGRRAAQFYELTLPSGRTVNPPPGRCWLYVRERFDGLVADGRVWFGRSGDSMPAIKGFLSEVPSGLVPITIWPHEEVGTTGTAKSEIVRLFSAVSPFATPKPEHLIERILQIASNEGDVVLDCFLGSGTTAAVAHKMGRRWVGVEREGATIDTYAAPRLSMVVRGEDPGGVTGSTAWKGGGGFRLLEAAQSMFEADAGMVFLAESMTNGKLAEATAAQLGFEYEVAPPFVGRKGRTRLAVVDGVVNEAVVRILAGALAERERVVICGTAIDTDARPILRELRPGSTLRKIPAALLDEYRSSRQLRLELAAEEAPPEAEATEPPVPAEVSA
ncbi:MAG: site-specific DNA-methyltransferase [Chloroflexota bacterium]|nr:site-specific DNA-methyltransferase [Chloroflexota bacterium]